MALRQCPECEGKVSSNAENCPHCGYVPKRRGQASQNQRAQNQQARQPPPAKKSEDSGGAFGTAVSATFGVLFALFLLFVAGPIMCCGGSAAIFGDDVDQTFEEAQEEVDGIE